MLLNTDEKFLPKRSHRFHKQVIKGVKGLATQDRSPFGMFHIMNKILQHPESIDTLETIGIIFRKMINSNAVNILKSTNEYYHKIIPKSGHKMDLYPAMVSLVGCMTFDGSLVSCISCT